MLLSLRLASLPGICHEDIVHTLCMSKAGPAEQLWRQPQICHTRAHLYSPDATSTIRNPKRPQTCQVPAKTSPLAPSPSRSRDSTSEGEIAAMGGRSAGGFPQAGLLPRDSQARAGASPSSGGTCQSTWLYTFALGRNVSASIRSGAARLGLEPLPAWGVPGTMKAHLTCLLV